MKKLIAMIVISMVLCSLSACTQEYYEDGYELGYEHGYREGCSDTEIEMEYLLDEEFIDGYHWGYQEGYKEAEIEYSDYRELEEKAIRYAREYSEWTPEDALVIIEAYYHNEPFNEDGSPPSKEDYLGAIDSLLYFYDYFYSRKYE